MVETWYCTRPDSLVKFAYQFWDKDYISNRVVLNARGDYNDFNIVSLMRVAYDQTSARPINRR